MTAKVDKNCKIRSNLTKVDKCWQKLPKLETIAVYVMNQMHFLLKSHKDANILFKPDCLSRNQTKNFSTFQLQLSQKALEGEGRRATGPWSFSNLEIQTGFLGFHPDAEFEQLCHEDR